MSSEVLRIKTPFLKPIADILPIVEGLRAKYPILNQDAFDMELFIERDLRMEIIPVSNLRADVGAEAIITGDFKSILLDSESYDDERLYRRLRFSLAHELGHMYLHRAWIAGHVQSERISWCEFMRSISGKDYFYMELQANQFAGMLLVPAEKLIAKLNEHSYFYIVADCFNVSRPVISKRMETEDVINKIKKEERQKKR